MRSRKHTRRLLRRLGLAACVLSVSGCDFITGDLSHQASSETDTGTSSTTGMAGVGTGESTVDVATQDEVATSTSAGSSSGGPVSGSTGGPPEANEGSCCEASPGAGCADPEVEDCVCAIDPFCCDDRWDELCADLVQDAMCGACEDAGECCEASLDPGCGNTDVEDCVCDVDSYCCTEEWDATCAAAVVAFGCGSCPLQDDPSCCVPHVTPSCEVSEIADCVCAHDSYCCEVQWDAACVSEVDVYDCGACDGSDVMPLSTGTGGDSGDSGGFSTGLPDATGTGP